MFLGHIPSTFLAWFSFRNYGFSDGADLFVFMSGYTSALVYTKRMVERGFVFGATRLLRRVWQIYSAHVLLFVIYPPRSISCRIGSTRLISSISSMQVR
jgi:hypothetical protein